jgi:hypothetical protein
MRTRHLLKPSMAAAAAVIAVTAVTAVTAAPLAASPPEGDHVVEEARIPLAGYRVRSFRTVGFDTVYFRVGRRDWYRATLIDHCLGLPNALRLGFDTHGSSTLDNTSSVIVGGESCRIHSLVRVAEPPPRRRRD